MKPRSAILDTLLSGALLATLAGCGQEPLSFAVQPIPVGYNRAEVLDAHAVDIDRDGDADIVAATATDMHFLESTDGRYSDMTGGTALGKVAAAQAMHRDGNDYILERGDDLSRLKYSGIGTWHELDGLVENFEPEPMLETVADLDGDGQDDRARLVGNTIVIEFSRGGGWLNVTSLVAVDGLTLPQPGRRIRAADLDGDGDMDLLVVGGRLFLLINNGGALARP